jgi:hypothetical protein
MSLAEAIRGLEGSLAAPSSLPSWRATVDLALDDLREEFARHVDVAEGGDGLLLQIVEDEPRLAGRAGQLKLEHVSLTAALTLARGLVRDDSVAPSVVRDDLTHLCARMARHRQAGADLVYEAYEVDLGAGD